MRCPYCGGLNADQAQFCRYCGRSFGPPTSPGQPALRQPPPQRPPYQQPQRPAYSPPRPPQQITPVQAPPYQRPASHPPAPPDPAVPQYTSGTRRRRQNVPTSPASSTPTPSIPPAPEPPAPFPPHNMEQLRALEPGALAYTLVSDEVGMGGKKIVRIAYARCVAWQQVATLLKAFREYQAEQFNTIVIQGVLDQNDSIYSFNNGQLWFDRHVRLGSQLINRYQIETGTGLESDSVRIVLAEE